MSVNVVLSRTLEDFLAWRAAADPLDQRLKAVLIERVKASPKWRELGTVYIAFIEPEAIVEGLYYDRHPSGNARANAIAFWEALRDSYRNYVHGGDEESVPIKPKDKRPML